MMSAETSRMCESKATLSGLILFLMSSEKTEAAGH